MSAINPVISTSSTIGNEGIHQSKLFSFNESFNTLLAGSDVSIDIDIPKTFYCQIRQIQSKFNYAKKVTGEYLTDNTLFAGNYIFNVRNEDSRIINSLDIPICSDWKLINDSLIFNGNNINTINLSILNSSFSMFYNNVANINTDILLINLAFMFEINYYSSQAFKLIGTRFIYKGNRQ